MGLPFSGKKEVASILEKEHDCMIIEETEVLEEPENK